MPKKGGRIKRLPNGTHGFLLPKGMDPDISTWTVENVVFWVSGLALEGARAIASRFRDKKVDGAAPLTSLVAHLHHCAATAHGSRMGRHETGAGQVHQARL